MILSRNNRMPAFAFFGWLLPAMVVMLLAGCASLGVGNSEGHNSQARARAALGQNEMPPIELIPDPLEPVNRSISAVNHVFMVGIITPTSWAYRHVLPLPARDGIRRFGNNLAYPVRLVSNALQWNWPGAGEETQRFLVNTTVGILGFRDPATGMGIGRSEEDLGQTLGRWGWRPQAFLMLPVFGPSNERDFLGRFGDAFFDPAEYFFPAAPFFAYNKLTYKVDAYHNLVATDYDPYQSLRMVTSLERDKSVINFPQISEPEDEAVQTLEYAVYFKEESFGFSKQGMERKARLENPKGKIPYTAWLQPGRAPVVYLLPGLGGHRLGAGNVALARVLYEAGYSVVTISNIMHPEFMKYGSRAGLPGNMEIDLADVGRALRGVRGALRSQHADRIQSEILMGVSLGGYLTLMACASEDAVPESERFARYIAINTPVSLYNGMVRLDSFYEAPLAWEPSERRDRMLHTVMKLRNLDLEALDSEDGLPFDAVESRFLIGLSFRMALRNLIHYSQRREDMGVIPGCCNWFMRSKAYSEIMNHGYEDYFGKFLIPYYYTLDHAWTRERILAAGDLRSRQRALAAKPNLRIINNTNDFLGTDGDIEWLRQTFGPDRLALFETGGHMGNLHTPEVQQAVLRALP